MNKRKFTKQEEIEFQCNLETMLENEQEERERDVIRAKYDKVEYDMPSENQDIEV